MDRKKALATAAAVVLSLAAGTAALASSLGMFGIGDASLPVGEQQSVQVPVASTAAPKPEVETVYVDVPASARPAQELGGDDPSATADPGATPEASAEPHDDKVEEESEDHSDDDHSPEPSDEHEDGDHGEEDD